MFEWIKTFIAVYETKNFSAAAKQLYISQPTVSFANQEIRATLFDQAVLS